jgi:hypothetical protein
LQRRKSGNTLLLKRFGANVMSDLSDLSDLSDKEICYCICSNLPNETSKNNAPAKAAAPNNTPR